MPSRSAHIRRHISSSIWLRNQSLPLGLSGNLDALSNFPDIAKPEVTEHKGGWRSSNECVERYAREGLK